MKRAKRHKVKSEKPETSTSYSRAVADHDLAYYIHDRVELMHQVFSVIKSKDIRTMAPDCVRKLPIDDLQELCTEELLGISSKRLCAILDGAEPPSDTESSSRSSSPPKFETISLDSISSDEEIMSHSSKKKKHKHKKTSKPDKKSKKKSRESRSQDKEKSQDKTKEAETSASKASRAGLTVLELLELQARARAIRAQLQKEQANKQKPAPVEESSSSDSEVEIKEEPAEVVEISSEDEKPDLKELEKAKNLPSTSKESNKEPTNNPTDKTKEKSKHKEKKNKKDKSKKNNKAEKKDNAENKRVSISSDQGVFNVNEKPNTDTTKEIATKTNGTDKVETANKVTKRINDLIVTVPQQHTKKIKLNRNKITVQIPNDSGNVEKSRRVTQVSEETTKDKDEVSNVVAEKPNLVAQKTDKVKKDKSRKKQKRKERKSTDKEGSDHDEITLQLSDTEKMDLLEDFDRKALDNVSSSDSSSSSDSESDSDSSEDDSGQENRDSSEIFNTSKENNGLSVSDTVNAEIYNAVDTNVLEKDNTNPVVNNTDKQIESPSEIIIDITENLNTASNIKVTENKSQNIEESFSKNDPESNTSALKGNNPIENENNEDNLVITDINDIPILNSDENQEQEQNVNKRNEQTSNSQVIEVPMRDTDENLDKNKNNSNDIVIIEDIDKTTHITEETQQNNTQNEDTVKDVTINTAGNENLADQGEEATEIVQQVKENEEGNNETRSDGELSEHSSSEVEAFDLKPEVLCISDEEDSTTKKKKSKKEKKSKKSKKKKDKKSDFREGSDQNFYKDANVELNYQSKANNETENTVIIDVKDIESDVDEAITIDDDEIMEILELSNDSSCYEVEGTVLSKEPTAEEIEALSARIDEIKREDVVTEEEIRRHEKEKEETQKETEELEDIENISWKDRYLGSKKVKQVLTTSNILNALRKKNKELKKKMEESKKKDSEEIEEVKKVEEKVVSEELEEGTIEHYNTLLGSNKYVDPVKEVVEETDPNSNKNEEQSDENRDIPDSNKNKANINENTNIVNLKVQVTGEMKKDAKQLLKMYKKLLKYNDITKQKDPNKKKKKSKKKKDKATSSETGVNLP